MMQDAVVLKESSGHEVSVAGLNLSDVIQLKCINRFTGCILVEAGPRTGSIFFRDGEIIHAEQGGETGENAFIRIVSWDAGKFQIQSKVTTTSHTITESWKCLLLDAHRLIDEGKIPDQKPDTSQGNGLGDSRGTEERQPMSGIAARMMDIPGVDYAVLFNRDGSPIGDVSFDAESLAAETLYLAMIGNRLGGIFSLGEVKSATVQGTDHHLLMFEGKQQYLGIVAKKESQLSVVEADIRKSLAPKGR